MTAHRTVGTGGQHAYGGRLGKDRSLGESRRCGASPQSASRFNRHCRRARIATKRRHCSRNLTGGRIALPIWPLLHGRRRWNGGGQRASNVAAPIKY